MSDPITLIVLVAAGDAASATTRAMARATREALGDAPVEVLETREPPSDDDALALERGAHAGAVVELTWSDPARRRVTLRVHLAQSGRWIERAFVFVPSDAPAEQGRMLGFAVGSMIPEAAASPGVAPPGEPPQPPLPARGEATAPAAPAVPAAPATPPVAVPPAPPLERGPAPPPPPLAVPELAAVHDFSSKQVSSSKGVVSLDVLALGAAGNAGGGGGGGSLAWFVVRAIALRLGGGARASNLDAAQSSTMAFFGSAGVVLQPWHATLARPFEVSLRADYLVLHQSLTHFDFDEPRPDTQARWLSGAAVVLDAGWLFAGDFGVVAGLGLEDDFGTTEVRDKGTLVAVIPSLRVTAEGGLRVRF